MSLSKLPQILWPPVAMVFVLFSVCVGINQHINLLTAFHLITIPSSQCENYTCNSKSNFLRVLYNYLQRRQQRVRINNSYSNFSNIECGVPQGSVLSHTSFTVFINDMLADVPSSVQTSLYAGDGAL